MSDIISLYCKQVIYTIEMKKKELLEEIINHPEISSYARQYIDKYDELLIEKYIELEKMLELDRPQKKH